MVFPPPWDVFRECSDERSRGFTLLLHAPGAGRPVLLLMSGGTSTASWVCVPSATPAWWLSLGAPPLETEAQYAMVHTRSSDHECSHREQRAPRISLLANSRCLNPYRATRLLQDVAYNTEVRLFSSNTSNYSIVYLLLSPHVKTGNPGILFRVSPGKMRRPTRRGIGGTD
jgi:hypothetical protein